MRPARLPVWLASDDVQRIVVAGMRAAEVRNRIRLLAQRIPELVIFPGHDLSRAPEDRADIVLHRGTATSDLFSVRSWPIA